MPSAKEQAQKIIAEMQIVMDRDEYAANVKYLTEILLTTRREALLEAARFVDTHVEVFNSGSSNVTVEPKVDGSLNGKAYAYALRALASEDERTTR
jgi:hypothetical protein